MNRISALLVEDDFITNACIYSILKELGISAAAVHNADAAIAVLDGGEQLTLLLTDIDLGRGPNGFDVARHARMRYPQLPIVFVSGGATASQQAASVAGSAFVAKPFERHQLRDAIGQACGLFVAEAVVPDVDHIGLEPRPLSTVARYPV